MNFNSLNKLHWNLLQKELSKFCQSSEAIEMAESLLPDLKREKIEERWRLVTPLKSLADQGYRAPIGDLVSISHVTKAASLGQQLDGMELRSILNLLFSVRKVHGFALDFADRCETLKQVKTQIYPLPKLVQEIDSAIDSEGNLHDDASPELKKIRAQKKQLRKKIEDKLRSLLHNSDFEQYLQDDFFTLRSERYVVPIRLDGRGRVKGSILDTSSSGQTLYIEPTEVTPQNEQLQELELGEKLEIIKIFNRLSKLVSENVEIIEDNYTELVQLDFLTAQGELANQVKGNSVKISNSPSLNLKNARHPLVKRSDGKLAIPNDITFNKESRILIISGPNAGGKTVVLETAGILHLMAKAGLLVPADDDSEMYLFDNIFVEIGDAQNLTANLSTFSGHLFGLKHIIEKTSEKDLLLLDEIGIGTEPMTGSAIAQAILEKISRKNAFTITTTHYDALKSLAIENKLFRNGSMEYSLKDFRPTYKLILDVPGQSYGLEVAEQLGLPADIIERAKELKGSVNSTLDSAVSQLMKARDEARESQQQLEQELLQAKSEKFRWQKEVEEIRNSRHKTAENLSEKYQDVLTGIKEKYEESLKEMEDANKAKKSTAQSTDALKDEKQKVEHVIDKFQSQLLELNKANIIERELPGTPSEFKELKKGSRVFITSLNKTGIIKKAPVSPAEPFQIEVGVLKIRSYISDLRTVREGKPKGKGPSNTPKVSLKPNLSQGKKLDDESLVIQTKRNSLDLRGCQKDDAMEKMWRFIDGALLRGEFGLVIIHGHGTDVVKNAIRDGLANNSPYDLSFRPGVDGEGGDGVTIVMIKN